MAASEADMEPSRDQVLSVLAFCWLDEVTEERQW